MKLSQQLKILAKGVNPDTGELLEDNSVANTIEGVRLLIALSDELSELEAPKKRNKKLTSEERREKNIAEGKPARSHFSWEDDEKENLKKSYYELKSVNALAAKFERSSLAIVVQLEKLSLISADEVEKYREQ